jgi:hypothetical protein
VTTISPCLAIATPVAARAITQASFSAATQSGIHAGGLAAVIAVVILLAGLAAVARAARAVVVLMTEFLRLAAAVTSVMLTALISAIVIGILLLHP